MTPAYYNEFDPEMASWLRTLIEFDLIAEGDVDERSIADVKASDLAGYTQCHFFAGLGCWSLALRHAGWPDDRRAWTGSCPCQPFSSAGKRKAHTDERHLWPEFFRLIEACRPSEVWGEQVASSEVVGTGTEAAFLVAVREGRYARANRLAKLLCWSDSLRWYPRWVDGVRRDMEGAGYAFRFDVLGAHSVVAPHIRQRLYWHGRLSDSERGGCRSERPAGRSGRVGNGDSSQDFRPETQDSGVACRPSDAQRGGLGVDGGTLWSGGHADSHEPVERIPDGDRDGWGAAGQRLDRCAERDLEHCGGEGTERIPESEHQPAGPGVAGVEGQPGIGRHRPTDGGRARRLHDAPGQGRQGRDAELLEPGEAEGRQSSRPGDAGGIPHSTLPEGARQRQLEVDLPGQAGFWSRFSVLPYRDGKSRRVEPEPVGLADGAALVLQACRAAGLSAEEEREVLQTFPLAKAFPGRRMLLKGYGNGLCVPTAVEFIRACREN